MSACFEVDFVPFTPVIDAVERGAVCMDGSPAGYHFAAGFGTGASSWLVVLMVYTWKGFSNGRASGLHGPSCNAIKRLSFSTENELLSQNGDPHLKDLKERKIGGKSANSTVMLVSEIRKPETRQRQLGEEANRALELLHKEVASQRHGSKDTVETIAKMLSEIKAMQRQIY